MISDWAQQKLRVLVKEVVERQLLSFPAIEAAAEWSLHGSVLVGRLRNATNQADWFWLIGGENLSTDIAPSSVANSPRELIRYFALRWQIGAAQLQDQSDILVNSFSTHAKASELQKMAEGLYRLSETEGIW